MKTWSICIVALAVLVFAGNCKKSKHSLVTEPGDLSGRWIHTAHFYSIGPPGQWHTVVPGQWIELRADGGFSSNLSPFSSASRYEVIDSIQLRLIIQPAGAPLIYRYSHRGDTLELTPVPFCIEGCAERFLKQ
jgi:hypothetical protein